MTQDEKLKKAVCTLIAASTTDTISRFVTPEGHVVVVARVKKDSEPKTVAEALARATCESEQHDHRACLYSWYYDHCGESSVE